MTFPPRFTSRTRRALVATAALAGMPAAGSATAQTKTIYIGMNGGTMERLYADKVLPAFEQANDVKVVIVPGRLVNVVV